MEGLDPDNQQTNEEQPPLEHPELQSLQVHSLKKQGEPDHHCPPTQRTHREYLTQRTLLKLYLKTHIIEECLESFDIFKDVLEDPHQRNKLVRDVMRSLKVETVEAGVPLYSKGDPAESIFMVLRGAVSLCLPVAREDLIQSDNTVEYEFKEIDSFEVGSGFGEAEFIQGTKRGLCALGKESGTVLGVLGSSAFEEVVEMYRQRVYFGKRDMFARCALLQCLKPHQLQFIVNNAKPVHFPISHSIVCEGEFPKSLYLITHGRVELRKQPTQQSRVSIRKQRKQFFPLEGELGSKRAVIGILEEGAFLGDAQLALGTAYSFQAICISERVRAYACNLKIIESQLGELLPEIKNHYLRKEEHRECQLRCYTEAKSQVKREVDSLSAVVLTHSQKKIKRLILNRYVEQKPTLVGKLSPQEISKSIQRKYARISNLTPLEQPRLPFLNRRPLVKNERALSPILKKRRHSTKEEVRRSWGGGEEGLSVVEMRHLYEFIGKLREQVQERR